MKIKTRLDDSGTLESDEWFRMNHWLAELRDDGQAEPRDDGQAGPPDDRPAGPRDDGQAEPRDDRPAGPRDDGRAAPPDDGRAGLPRHGYPAPEAVAAAPADRPVARAEVCMRAVIGDQLRIPIMWCEMGSCISWYAHRAALGEADVRARAISAGWRVDAVGLLVCPQCQQTAAGFRSPRPVALWDRDEAIIKAAQMATVPSGDTAAGADREIGPDLRRPDPGTDTAAGADREISHDLRRWASGDDAAGTAPWEDSHDLRGPAGDQPVSPAQPGRHRKRFAARILPASLHAR